MVLIPKDIVWNIDDPKNWPRGYRAAVSHVSKNTMQYDWHRRMFPDHFKKGADQIYGYKPRSGRYLAYKRKTGRDLPIFFSGKTRSWTKQWIKITGRGTTTSGLLHAPWYVRMKPTKRNAPNLGAELTEMTTDEMQEVAETMARRVAKRMMRRRRTVQRIR